MKRKGKHKCSTVKMKLGELVVMEFAVPDDFVLLQHIMVAHVQVPLAKPIVITEKYPLTITVTKGAPGKAR